MKVADVVLVRLPQTSGGASKLRPALVLALLPGPYQNILICGISTQVHHLEPDWDELIEANDWDFAMSGLHRSSAIRLSYLHSVEVSDISGVIGRIDVTRLERLRNRLINRLK